MANKGIWMASKGIDWDIYDCGGVYYVQRCDDVETITDEQAVLAAREAGYNVADDGRVLETPARGESFDLFTADLQIARDLVERCCEEDGEQRYFDLSVFLERLADAIECRHFETKKLGRFSVDASTIARYLWCCISLEEGYQPDGPVFRGMSILD